MPTLTINGRSITVEPSTSVLQAARRLGIEVPHFCWHPYLTVAGNCRMCLVEIEKQPKLAISCATPAAEGMVVRTDSDKVKDAVQGVLEFLLINHPIDCPICDQAGECYLQDYYMVHGLHESRIPSEDKVPKGKRIDLGPIVLDQERCVLCSRCVRYTSEFSKTGELYIFERGDRSEVRTFQDRALTGQYTGNLADVCPVGALTSTDFRFKKRVWFLKSTPSVCHGCAAGCSTWIDWDQATVYRLRPRDNPHVNKLWMCDPGRATYRELHQTDRLLSPEARTPGAPSVGLAPISSDRALEQAAAQLQADPASTAFVLSARLSVEDLFAGAELARALRVAHVAVWLAPEQDDPAAPEDGILRLKGPFPNTLGARATGAIPSGTGRAQSEALLAAMRAGAIKTILLAGADDLPRTEIGRAILAELGHVDHRIVLAAHAGEARERATLVLPLSLWAEQEGTVVNGAGRLQLYRRAFDPPGDARPAHALFLALWQKAGLARPATLKDDSPRQIFRWLASASAAFANMSHDTIGALGVPLQPADAPLATVAP